ncbi:hypothetical protein EDB80DRAFT_784230 [Ilyonectria destructans]|nr:hypothetical protein EDB80DRAFT_784230 [Ilyonectria destructans]
MDPGLGCVRLLPLFCVGILTQCTAGQQKKVGRPRRAAASGDEAPQDPDNSGCAPEGPRCTPVEGPNPPKPPSRPQEASSFLKRGEQLDWSSMISPAATPGPVLVTAPDDAFVAAPRNGAQPSQTRELPETMGVDDPGTNPTAGSSEPTPTCSGGLSSSVRECPSDVVAPGDAPDKIATGQSEGVEGQDGCNAVSCDRRVLRPSHPGPLHDCTIVCRHLHESANLGQCT